MTINVSKDVESAIDAAVQGGRYESAEKMIEKLVLEEAERAQPRIAYNQQSPEVWMARFRAWVDSHPARDIVIDDSRETIYAGRGE